MRYLFAAWLGLSAFLVFPGIVRGQIFRPPASGQSTTGYIPNRALRTDGAGRTATVIGPGSNCVLANGTTAPCSGSSATITRVCEITIDGGGEAVTDDQDALASCRNKYKDSDGNGITLTIQSVECWANAGSPTVRPIITGGAADSILTGNLTCGAGSFAAGTKSGTPTLAPNASIDANVSAAGGVATYIKILITFTSTI